MLPLLANPEHNQRLLGLDVVGPVGAILGLRFPHPELTGRPFVRHSIEAVQCRKRTVAMPPSAEQNEIKLIYKHK